MSITTPDITLDFLSLYADQTEEVILARWEDWANEGLDPVEDADQWVDTREGAHWRTTTQQAIRECARLYDLMGTEVPMSAFVLWSWGTYLDDLAATYDVFRLSGTLATGLVTFSGPAGDVITVDTTVGTEPASPDDPAPTFAVTQEGTIPDAGGGVGSIDLPIVATQIGVLGNVSAGAITVPSTPLPGVALTNAAPTLGGSDPETDDSLRGRTLQALKGKGPGTVADLIRWASAWPGVGKAEAVAAWRGAGTSMVMITDVNGRPLPPATIAGLQTELDPDPGQGAGTAPIGNELTVETSALLNVTITATVVFDTGFSIDGFGGTTALRAAIEAAIQTYLLTVKPGDDIVFEKIKGLIATTNGVHDVTAMTLNAGGVNVAVALDPPQAPTLITPITVS